MTDEAERERIARERYMNVNDNGPEWEVVPPGVRKRYLAEADEVLAASPPRRTRKPAALGAEYGGYAAQPSDPYDAMVAEKVFGKKPVTTYDVIIAPQLETLARQVDAKLADGWEVTGGIAVRADVGSITGSGAVVPKFAYLQAMIRREMR